MGAGRWGQTLAHKLASVEDIYLHSVVDPDMPSCEGLPLVARLDGVPQAAIVATPPHTHVAVVRELAAAGVRKIRIEKPCGLGVGCVEELRGIADDYAVEITCGYQMLHSKAWRLARAWAMVAPVTRIDAYRLAAGGARHETSALLDLGSHAAAYVADLPKRACEPSIIAQHDALTDSRTLRMQRADESMLEMHGDARVVIDEIDFNPTYGANDDPLLASLEAWRDGGGQSLDFAARVHDILDEQVES
jgi:predicted dehydrogenase